MTNAKAKATVSNEVLAELRDPTGVDPAHPSRDYWHRAARNGNIGIMYATKMGLANWYTQYQNGHRSSRNL
jgi:hypothetical protein